MGLGIRGCVWRVIGCLPWLLTLGYPGFGAGTPWQGELFSDVIPATDPAYDYLATLTGTAANLRPRPLTFAEWQAHLAQLPSSSVQQGLDHASPNLQHLMAVARWRAGLTARLPKETLGYTAQMFLRGFPEQTDWHTARGAYRLSGFAALSEEVLLEVALSDQRRLEGDYTAEFDLLPLARLLVRREDFQVEIGRGNLRWGSGLSGGLLVGDTTPPIHYFRFGFPLPLPLLGNWQVEQFYSEIRENGRRHWWLGRRAWRPLGLRWSLTLNEAAKALKLPNGVLTQFLPLYLYQYWMQSQVGHSGWFNYLAEIGLQYHGSQGEKAYLFVLADDLQAPNFLRRRRTVTPRKLGLLIGGQWQNWLLPGSRWVLEALYTDGTEDGGTYGAAGHEADYAYFYKGLPMGHPIGTNRRGLYARVEWGNARWWFALEGWSTAPTTQQIPVVRGQRLEAELGYQLHPQSLLLVRYRTRNETRPDGVPDRRSGWWLEWSQRF